MLTIDALNAVRENDRLSQKQKIAMITSFLDKNRVYYSNGNYYYHFLDEDIPVVFHSASLIRITNDNQYKKYNDGPLQQYYQYRVSIERIMKAINSICLKEDKMVFVEKFVYQKKVEQIISDHYLSCRGFYICLKCGCNDFCKNLKIKQSG